jgi:hypothetical protein
MDSHNSTTHYALLVGINAYSKSPLKYCVQDVLNIKEYLNSALSSVNIRFFTAAETVNLKPSDGTEDSVLRPTYERVTRALEEVTRETKPGDFVYVHFSGHGTRVSPDDTFSNKSTGDLGLVLLNSDNNDKVKYLWGSTLAVALEAMVNKGLSVTLVLDCCFSAAVYRRDQPGVRFLPYDAEVDSEYSMKSFNLSEIPEIETEVSENRDASMKSNWLIQSDRYAIFSACGPHELASEFISEDKEGHGALSYFLLRALNECGGVNRPHKYIYDNVRANFRKHWPRQHPVLYGNKDQGFFGHPDLDVTSITIPIVERDNYSLELQAGQAHGVCEDDQFTAYFVSSTDTDPRSEGIARTVKVIRTRALTSDLELLDMTTTRFRAKGPAKPRTRALLRRFPIGLAADIPFRAQWLTALTARSLGVFNTDQEQFAFQIVSNSNKEYKILDKDEQKIVSFPSTMTNQTDLNSVCDFAEHLAKFELARNLVNVMTSDLFRESYDVEIVSRAGKVYSPGSVIEMKHDAYANYTLELRVENKGNEVLYVCVYNLGPCWQIQNILRGSYEVVPPRDDSEGFTGVFRKKVKTVVPPEISNRSLKDCKDIIKVFVTSQPTSFDILELPKLGDAVKRRESGEDNRDSSGRSLEDWAALNFSVHTFLE